MEGWVTDPTMATHWGQLTAPAESSGNAVDQNTCHETAVSPQAACDVPIRFAWMAPLGTR